MPLAFEYGTARCAPSNRACACVLATNVRNASRGTKLNEKVQILNVHAEKQIETRVLGRLLVVGDTPEAFRYYIAEDKDEYALSIRVDYSNNTNNILDCGQW